MSLGNGVINRPSPSRKTLPLFAEVIILGHVCPASIDPPETACALSYEVFGSQLHFISGAGRGSHQKARSPFTEARAGLIRTRSNGILSRQQFKDDQPAFRDAAALESSLQEASTGVALMSDLAGVNVGVQPLSGPAFPCRDDRGDDQVTGAAGARSFIPKHGAIDANLPVVRFELSPDEQGARVGRQKNHLASGSDKLRLLAGLAGAVVTLEQRKAGVVPVFNRYPGAIGKQEGLFGHERIVPHFAALANSLSLNRAGRTNIL